MSLNKIVKSDVTAQIKKTKKRIAEINHMVKQLFEEKVTGSIPESMYKTMVAQYCDEKDDLCAELDILERDWTNRKMKRLIFFDGLIICLLLLILKSSIGIRSLLL